MHLETILGRLKEAVGELTEQYGELRLAAEHSESMPTNDPNYQPLMTKQDDTVDKINESVSDITGLVSDIKTLAGA